MPAKTATPLHSDQAQAARNAQVLATWGDEPFGPLVKQSAPVERAVYLDRVDFGLPADRPLASTLDEFRRDIAISNLERGQ